MSETVKRVLSSDELDTIGEIMNISMGAAATAISTMLERQVIITTPSMEQDRYKNIDSSGVEPALIVKITYTQGIDGVNTTMLRRRDMQVILDILMGNEEPTSDEDFEFDDMSMSAACEIMNQMMGASATALSEILETTINISTPEALLVESVKDIEESFLNIAAEDQVIAISFNMSIKDVLNTTFITFLPIPLALRIISHVSSDSEELLAEESKPTEEMLSQMATPAPTPMPAPMQDRMAAQEERAMPQQMNPNMGQPQAPQGWNIPPQQMAYAAQYPTQQQQYESYMMQQNSIPVGQNPYPYGMPQQMQGQGGYTPPPVTVQKAEFPDFSQQGVRGHGATSSNMGLLMGVQLEVSVVIGKTKRKIKDIMDFGQGSVIELDKQTGAPAEIVVNGQLLAYGDVIVVGDNFGVRITEIVGSKELVDLLANNR